MLKIWTIIGTIERLLIKTNISTKKDLIIGKNTIKKWKEDPGEKKKDEYKTDSTYINNISKNYERKITRCIWDFWPDWRFDLSNMSPENTKKIKETWNNKREESNKWKQRMQCEIKINSVIYWSFHFCSQRCCLSSPW